MPANADAEAPDLSGAERRSLQVLDNGARIVVVRSNCLGDLVLVAAVGAGTVVGQHLAGLFHLVENLRYGDHESVTRQNGGRTFDRSGDLEYFREEQHSGIAPRRDRPKDSSAHRAGGGGQIDIFFLQNHGYSS